MSLYDIPANETIFYKFFLDLPEAVSETGFQSKALDIIENEVQPALKKFSDFLHGEYSTHLRSDIGVSSLQDSYYQAVIDFYSDNDASLNADVLHQMGMDELRELQQAMIDFGMNHGYNTTTFKEFAAAVKSNSEFQFESSEEALQFFSEAATVTITEKLGTVLPDDLLTPDLLDIHVKQIPEGQFGFAYAEAPSYDGRRVGEYFIGSNNPNTLRKYDAISLGLHEAIPGHLLHFGYFSKANVSDIIRVNPSKYPNIPSHFPFYGAFMEGWALYCESLGFEMGLYEEDPYQLVGYYSYNMLRAGRLVVDTGIHGLGWSREKAIDFLFENTLQTRPRAEQQIDRYITWPGQALSYKIGERKMKQLRTTFEDEMGDKFDLKVFHRNVLKCSGPLTLLEECIRRQFEAFN